MLGSNRGQVLIEGILALATILLFVTLTIRFIEIGTNEINKYRFIERLTNDK